MSGREPNPAPPSDLRARVLAEVARTPAPTRAEHARRTALVAVLGTLATAALFSLMGGFARGDRPVALVAFTAGVAAFAALVLTRVTTSAGSMLGRPRHVLVLACVLTAPALALAALASALLWSHRAPGEVPPVLDLACGLLTIMQGVLPLVALIVARRGSDPVHPAITGALVGMTAGAWTAMMAYLRCPHPQAFHCVVAHVVPTLVLMVTGALLGTMVLKVR